MLLLSDCLIVELKPDTTLKLPILTNKVCTYCISVYIVCILCYLGGVGIVRIPPLEVDVRCPRFAHNATI